MYYLTLNYWDSSAWIKNTLSLANIFNISTFSSLFYLPAHVTSPEQWWVSVEEYRPIVQHWGHSCELLPRMSADTGTSPHHTVLKYKLELSYLNWDWAWCIVTGVRNPYDCYNNKKNGITIFVSIIIPVSIMAKRYKYILCLMVIDGYYLYI